MTALPVAKSETYYLLVVYLLTIGLLFMWGYWETFGINIFPFIGIWDVLKFSAIILAPISMVIFLMLAFAEAIYDFPLYILKKIYPRLATKNKSEDSNIQKETKNHPLLDITIGLVILIFGPKYSSYALYAALPFFIYPFIINARFWVSISHDVRPLVIFALLFLGCFSYPIGKIYAETITNGETWHAEFEESNKIMKFQFIGHVNNYDFFINQETNTIKILSAPETLTLHKN